MEAEGHVGPREARGRVQHVGGQGAGGAGGAGHRCGLQQRHRTVNKSRGAFLKPMQRLVRISV